VEVGVSLAAYYRGRLVHGPAAAPEPLAITPTLAGAVLDRSPRAAGWDRPAVTGPSFRGQRGAVRLSSTTLQVDHPCDPPVRL